MVTAIKSGHALGFHRVLDDPKVLPQNAKKLDARSGLYDNEVLIQVDELQIDSASFAQLKKEYPDEEKLKKTVMQIVDERGKMQNPVTGSGGMLLGTVKEIGSNYPDKSLKKNMKLATLVSLTATPLQLDSIDAVDFKKERLQVCGKAILFEKSLYVPMPDDISEGAALAAFDICGAPLLTVNHVKEGDTVFVLGLGKAGRSVVAAIRYRFGEGVRILGADSGQDAVEFCLKYYENQQANNFAVLDAQDTLQVMRWVEEQTDGKMADVTINLVNVANTEMPSILATKDEGTCILFSMATDFQKATLGAESVGKDVRLVMGRGFVRGHGEFMLELLRCDRVLRGYFEGVFGG